MNAALAMARLARLQGAVPVGAVVVHNNRIVARAHNDLATDTCALPNPLKHAEILAMSIACQTLSTQRLDGCHLYVTLEPCSFCLGAANLMRISKIVFGAYAPEAQKNGPKSVVETLGGILEYECAQELSAFFQEKRRIDSQCDRLMRIRRERRT